MKKGFNFVLSIQLVSEPQCSHFYKAGFFCSIAKGLHFPIKRRPAFTGRLRNVFPRASGDVDSGKPAGRFLFAGVNITHHAYYNNSSTPEAPRPAQVSHRPFEPIVCYSKSHTRTNLGSPERIQRAFSTRYRRPGSSLQTVNSLNSYYYVYQQEREESTGNAGVFNSERGGSASQNSRSFGRFRVCQHYAHGLFKCCRRVARRTSEPSNTVNTFQFSSFTLVGNPARV